MCPDQLSMNFQGKPTDFNIPQNAVVSVQLPNGGAFNVPIIHPWEYNPKKKDFWPGGRMYHLTILYLSLHWE